MWSFIQKTRNAFIGYRKMTVIMITIIFSILLLILGYPVEKLSWLGTPIGMFLGSNIVEHIPAIISKYKEKK